MSWRLRIKPNGGSPLYKQIEDSIRSAITRGELKPEDRLPSVADIARDLKINKLTAHKVFQRLEKAGLLRSEVGRGTFVASAATNNGTPTVEETPKPELARSIRRLREGYARALRELMAVERRPGTINLSGGLPTSEMIPDGLLERLTKEVLKKNPGRLYELGSPSGLNESRDVLAERLGRRGIVAGPDEILITNGSQQAISLVAAWSREDGRSVISETPTHPGGPGSFMLFGHAVQCVAWENGAPNLDQLRAISAGRPSLFYICPDFHNPTGLTASVAVRREIADWASRNDAIVLVDEIFREMRFEGEDLPSLYSMLPAGRRIMVGSISKSFMPGLRAGYLVSDRVTINELLPYKRYMDLGGPTLTQAIAGAFMKSGYDAYLERMRAYHKQRLDAALVALKKFMPEGVSWTRPQGGFQLWVTMPQGISSVQLFLNGIEQGVSIVPGPAHDIAGGYLNSFRLGYGQASPKDIQTGIQRLAGIIEKLIARGPDARSASGLGIML